MDRPRSLRDGAHPGRREARFQALRRVGPLRRRHPLPDRAAGQDPQAAAARDSSSISALSPTTPRTCLSAARAAAGAWLRRRRSGLREPQGLRVPDRGGRSRTITTDALGTLPALAVHPSTRLDGRDYAVGDGVVWVSGPARVPVRLDGWIRTAQSSFLVQAAARGTGALRAERARLDARARSAHRAGDAGPANARRRAPLGSTSGGDAPRAKPPGLAPHDTKIVIRRADPGDILRAPCSKSR